MNKSHCQVSSSSSPQSLACSNTTPHHMTTPFLTNLIEDSHRILNHLPFCDFAIAYGSAALPQLSYSYENHSAKNKAPLLDLILGVQDPLKWHRTNMDRNWHHYSLLGYAGPKFAWWLQSKGPGLYFNIDKKGARPVKYGVIHIDALRSDLRNWDSLYASGRMQKPFVVLHSDGSIAEANEVNIANAVKASLLLLPHQFTENDFLETYAGISYMGDIRVKLRAENPDKVGNIVKSQIEQFREHLWSSPSAAAILESVTHFPRPGSGTDPKKQLEQDGSVSSKVALLEGLPEQLLHRIHARARALAISNSLPPLGVGTKELRLRRYVESGFHASLLKESISAVVSASSAAQATKGLLTVGLWSSMTYAFSKLAKYQWLPQKNEQESSANKN